MTDMPLISIITITYNAARELPATMESVKKQTFRNFEHIIIDGASTDDTLDLARKTGTAALRILSEPDKGLYDAMNKGLRMARGEYVLFLNAGDSFHTEEILARYGAKAVRKPDIIYADTVIVNADRSVIGPRHLSAPDILSFKSFSKGMLVCHQAFMVRRSLAPAYDTSYHFSADYDWTVKCLKKSTPGKCINLHTVAIDYLSNGMTDHNKFKSLKERFKIMSHHYGLPTTLINHVSFVGRTIGRKTGIKY